MGPYFSNRAVKFSFKMQGVGISDSIDPARFRVEPANILDPEIARANEAFHLPIHSVCELALRLYFIHQNEVEFPQTFESFAELSGSVRKRL